MPKESESQTTKAKNTKDVRQKEGALKQNVESTPTKVIHHSGYAGTDADAVDH